MVDQQLLNPSWPDCSFMGFNTNEDSNMEQLVIDMSTDMEFISSSLYSHSMEEDNFSSTPCFSSIFSKELLPGQDPIFSIPHHDLHLIFPFPGFEADFDEFGLLSSSNFENPSEVVNVFGWMEQISDVPPLQDHSSNEEGSMSSSPISSAASECGLSKQLQPVPVAFPPVEKGDHDTTHHPGLFHLLKAYGEARDAGAAELAEVVASRIGQMASPVGTVVERFGHYLFRASSDARGGYLKQESRKNHRAAFHAFYDRCPYARFAHFAANAAILEAMPAGAETIHVVDFDMREGVQWPPLMEAVGPQRSLHITSIKWEVTHDDGDHPDGGFEATKRRLTDYARSRGLRMVVDEMDIGELLHERKKMKKRTNETREWLAFNCMVSLPQMGQGRSSRNAWDFLMIARELITNSNNIKHKNGIITFGSGNGILGKSQREEKGSHVLFSYGSHLDRCLVHFKALSDSMEWHLPSHLLEARTAIESLFVGPHISSLACFTKWDIHEKGTHEDSWMESLEGEGWRWSQESVEEAKEMVRISGRKGCLYEIKLGGGKDENEMVLEWRGTPLVRVSAWRL